VGIFMRIAIIASIAFLLTACGGGGGGPNGGGNPLLRSQVPYHTPVHITTIDPLVNNTANRAAITDLFAEDLTGTGADNVVVAGRMSAGNVTAAEWKSSKISVLGWNSGKLVDQTSQWFAPGDNVILGTEPSVKFSSFNNNGRKDMFVAPSTDGIVPTTEAYVYFNNGSNFSKYTIDLSQVTATEAAFSDHKNFVHAHDSAIADLNGDGFKDIIIGDYGWNTTLAFNNQNRTFTTYTQQFRNLPGSSSLAVADFLNNGTMTLFAVDQGHVLNKPGLYSWAIDGSNNLNFTNIIFGPTPRFELAKWDSFNFGGGAPGNRGHNVRVVANDWDNNGVMDAIILSRPTNTNGVWPEFSEIQFVRNDGHGNFTDATDSVLVGYDTSTNVSYNPKFFDINGDGLTDILLSGAGDFVGANNSTQVLIKTQDGKFVSAFQNIVTDFSKQANAAAGANNSGNTVTIVKSPDNKFYLVTAAHLYEGRHAVYMSLLGDNIVSASQAISTIQAQWPWMSAVSANDALARTTATYLNGQVIDLEAAMRPIGSIGITLEGQTQARPITGYLAGINLNGLGAVKVNDSLGRDFNMNISPMNVVNATSSWARNTNSNNQLQLHSQAEYLVSTGTYDMEIMRIAGNDYNYSIGTPTFRINDRWQLNAQFTNLTFNPWVQFSGIWGSVNTSSILETVVTYRQSWLQGQFGVMHVDTQITPGLITSVKHITAAWAELGHNDNQFGLFVGVRPTIIAGSVEANLPTSVDNQGNLHYTKTNLDVVNPINGYVRALYQGQVNKQIGYRLSGMYIDNGQYRAQAEVKLSF
jgi:hypothetical protein